MGEDGRGMGEDGRGTEWGGGGRCCRPAGWWLESFWLSECVTDGQALHKRAVTPLSALGAQNHLCLR